MVVAQVHHVTDLVACLLAHPASQPCCSMLRSSLSPDQMPEQVKSIVHNLLDDHRKS